MKVAVIVLSLAILCVFSSCSIREEKTAPPKNGDDNTYVERIENSEDVNTEEAFSLRIMASEGFDNCGFTHFICPQTAGYSFISSGNEEITWTVYVLDEEFEGAARYISHGPYHEPVLNDNGTLQLEEGKYIYIQCSVNGFTTDTPNTTDYLDIIQEN